jgi:hypothetical protein
MRKKGKGTPVWAKPGGWLIGALVLMLPSPSMVSAKPGRTSAARACQVDAVVRDPDPAGLNVRATPRNGAIVGRLPNETAITLVESRDRWVRVGRAWRAEQPDDQALPTGWVFSGLLTTSLKTPEEYGPRTIPKLRQRPTADSPFTRLDWRAKPTIKIVGCDGAFLEVVIQSGRTKRRGYLGADSHCASTVTNCS